MCAFVSNLMRIKGEINSMKCPSCNVHLKRSHYSGVEYAACPECDGVWMQPADFDRILEKAELHRVADWNDESQFELALHRTLRIPVWIREN